MSLTTSSVSSRNQKFRGKLRTSFDAMFVDRTVGLERIGGESSWIISPSILPPRANVISGGAGKDISFELELAHRGHNVAVFDPSPTGAATFEKVGHVSNLHAFPIGLSGESSKVEFAAPLNALEGSFRIPGSGSVRCSFWCDSFPSAAKRAGFESVDLLKIDIEGFEYNVITSMLSSHLRPKQIALEFHHFLPGIRFHQTVVCCWRLWRAGYRIAYKSRFDYLFICKRDKR